MARSIIASGSIWRIGNGESVNIWTDTWIKDSPDFKPTTPIIAGLEDLLRVSTLCFNGLPSWNFSLLEHLVNDQDIAAICKMLLPYGARDDKLIWNFTKDGHYTVKSGYRVACLLNQIFSSPCRGERWVKLWQISMPPKIKIFLLRLCSGILPTRLQLLHKNLRVFLSA